MRTLVTTPRPTACEFCGFEFYWMHRDGVGPVQRKGQLHRALVDGVPAPMCLGCVADKRIAGHRVDVL